MYLVKKILNAQPYQLTLQFNNGEIRVVNLEEKIKSKLTTPTSKYKMLLDKNYFTKVKVHHEWKTIFWDNGLDFCPDVLYQMSQQKNE